MASNPMFTRPQLDEIRIELQTQVNQTTLELVMASLEAKTVDVPVFVDETTHTVRYTRLPGGRVQTMIPDAQVGGIFSPLEAANTGELLARVSNHPRFRDKTLTLEEIR